ncbi:unnamed protein product [Clonostachys solani]|uniref:RRM domain-containing protein n=1 Tax=Clonostachys solani TaxID=160281 RepID=A0A9P0EK57_9HYPO|nr:unnamed protein product [Clonostachys solani]
MPSEMIPQPSNFALERVKPKNESRRVIISNLPSGVSIAQVLRGVRGFGPVVKVFLIDTAKIEGQGTKSASIEFVSSNSAAAFAFSAKSDFFIEYEDNQTRRTADVWLVPGRTQGAKFTSESENVTRCFKIDNFPVHAVWFFICAMGGEKAIVHAAYNHKCGSEALTVEFVSLAHSTQAYQWLQNKEFPFYAPSPGSLHWIAEDETRLGLPSPNTSCHSPDDSSNSFYIPTSESIDCFAEEFAEDEFAEDETESDLPSPNTGCRTPPDYSPRRQFVAYIAPDQITISFDKVPYNEDWPDIEHPIMSLYHLEPRSREEMEEACRQEVELMAENLTLRRRGWSWQATYGGSCRRTSFCWDTIISSMSSPRLEGTWKVYFSEHQDSTIDLQKWGHYARLAQHRRELCAQQGLPDGQIPKCPADCKFGCVGIKMTPVSEVIQHFFEKEWN